MSKRLYIIPILAFALLILVVISILTGSAAIGFVDLLGIFSDGNEINRKIILDIRLPRILNAIFAGASLSVSGIILQSLLKNKLAEPGLLGISAGAGLGAILIFILPMSVSFVFVTPVSFIFAVLTTLIIFLVARGLNNKYTNYISSNKIILAGIAINALISSVNGFLLLKSGQSVTQIIYWLNGGLSGRGWFEFFSTVVFIIIGLAVSLFISKDLNVLSLGEELSQSIGLNVKLIQKISISVSSLLAASAVSVAGIVSFVGLIIPNIAKLLVGSNHKYSIPCSMLLGAVFFVASDTIARTIISPAEIPVGIITSFLGAPVFIWLLVKKSNIN